MTNSELSVFIILVFIILGPLIGAVPMLIILFPLAPFVILFAYPFGLGPALLSGFGFAWCTWVSGRPSDIDAVGIAAASCFLAAALRMPTKVVMIFSTPSRYDRVYQPDWLREVVITVGWTILPCIFAVFVCRLLLDKMDIWPGNPNAA